MPNYKIPNAAGSAGKTRTALVQDTGTVTMSTSSIPQQEVIVPKRGDIAQFQIELTQSTTGTLSTASDLSYAISEVSVKDVNGRTIISKLRGRDLNFFERMRSGVGRSRTVSTTSSSSQTWTFNLPLNIEKKHQPCRLQVTFAPYSDMASSGATGGSVQAKVRAVYCDDTRVPFTERVTRITKAVSSGTNAFSSDLPQGLQINEMLFKIGTETNISEIEFSEEGTVELAQITPKILAGFDDAYLVDGHVTGQFSLYVSPYISNSQTLFNVEGAGSDTMELYLVYVDPKTEK